MPSPPDAQVARMRFRRVIFVLIDLDPPNEFAALRVVIRNDIILWQRALSACLHMRLNGRMPAKGRVTRASPVQTAVRNCTRDEGRSFGFGNQVLIPSHRKLLRLNVVVVSVAEMPGR